MIPLHDDNPTRRAPWMTRVLIVANAAVFGYELLLASAGRLDTFVLAWAFVPARFMADPLSARQIATVFTSMFIHVGLLHIAGNMLYLWVFGDNVEDRLGHARFLGFYLLCGVAALAGQTLAAPHADLAQVGASGAIAGVLGAYLLLYPRARVLTAVIIVILVELVDVPAVLIIGLWFVLQLASGLLSLQPGVAAGGGVAYLAHVGGFVAGLLLAVPLRLADRPGAARFTPGR